MEFDITKLIYEIKARKPLWQKDNHNHNCREVINKLWIEVANIMGVSKELVKTKWKGLRDNFRSELRKIPKKHYEHRSKWIYFNDMMFLKDQMSTSRPADAFISGDVEDVNIDVDVYTMDDENEDDECNKCVTKTDYGEISEKFEYRTVNLNDMTSGMFNEYPYDKYFSLKYINLNTNAYEMLPKSNMLKCSDNVVSTTTYLDDLPSTNWQCYSDGDESNVSDGLCLLERENHEIKKRKLTPNEVYCSGYFKNYAINAEDDDFNFLMSLLPTVKTLSPAKKMFLRLKIQELVYNEVYFKNSIASSNNKHNAANTNITVSFSEKNLVPGTSACEKI